MAAENRWSTRGFDLIKVAVLFIMLLLLAVVVIDQVATPAGQEPPASDVAQGSKLVPAALIWDAPRTGADGSTALTGRAEPGSVVELWKGATRLATLPLDADGNWWYVGRLDPGEYNVVARTLGAQGQVLKEAVAKVALVPAGPAAEQAIEFDPPRLGPAGAVILSGRARPGSTVELSSGAINLGTVTADANGNWSYTGRLDPGEYWLVARTLDAEGKVVDQSNVVVARIRRVEPAAGVVIVQIDPPTVGADGGLSLSGRAEPGSKVELWAGPVKLGEVLVGDGGNWSYGGHLEPGDYRIVARTLNAQGEALNESEPVAVHVGAAAPAAGVAIVRIDPPRLEADGRVFLSGQAAPGASVTLLRRDSPVEPGQMVVAEEVIGKVLADSNGNWSYTVELPPGQNWIRAEAIGDGGILGETERVVVVVPELGVLGLTVNEPQSDKTGQVVLSGTTQPGETVEIVDKDVVVASVVAGPDGTWTVRYAGSPGDHTLVVRIKGHAADGPALGVPVTVPASVSASAGGHDYVVQKGDWLARIARRTYGDAHRWMDIYNATNAKAAQDSSYHRIWDPDHLIPGWKIWIPEP